MTRILISGDENKVKSATLGGTPDAVLKEWFDWAKGQKNVVASTADGVTALEVNASDTAFSALAYAISQGFTVEGAPIFMKMDADTYAGEVPEGIRNRLDAEDNVITWESWHDDTHHHMDANDGDKIVAGNSWGEELSSAELAILLGAGYTMRLGHEIVDWMPVSEL